MMLTVLCHLNRIGYCYCQTLNDICTQWIPWKKITSICWYPLRNNFVFASIRNIRSLILIFIFEIFVTNMCTTLGTCISDSNISCMFHLLSFFFSFLVISSLSWSVQFSEEGKLKRTFYGRIYMLALSDNAFICSSLGLQNKLLQ